MTRSRRVSTTRDTDPTPFAAILADLIARMPGAFAAALVDSEGECVDYTGRTDPFELKIAAAHWRIVLADAAPRLGSLGPVRTLLIRAHRRSFLAHGLPDDYAMIVLLTRRAGFTASRRALDLCERALCAEASWPVDAGPHWYPIRVECRGRKPARVAAEVPGTGPTRPRASPLRAGAAPKMRAVEVLGSVVGPDPRERGYRVRLDTGAELTVVREAGGFWYADEALPTARAHS